MTNSLARSIRSGVRLNEADTEPLGILAASVDTELPLTAILPRFGGDTRPLNPANVAILAESISALELIEPIVIDRCHRLIAGNHRKMAVSLLSVQGDARKELWVNLAGPGTGASKLFKRISELPLANGQIPVRILSFDSKERPELALAAEIAENEKRRPYSSSDVIEVANRLRSIPGIRDSNGRPKNGQAALIPCLKAIVQKSEKTIRRILDGQAPSTLTTRSTKSPREKLKQNLAAYLESTDEARTASLTSAIQAILGELSESSEVLDVDPEQMGLPETVSF